MTIEELRIANEELESLITSAKQKALSEKLTITEYTAIKMHVEHYKRAIAANTAAINQMMALRAEILSM